MELRFVGLSCPCHIPRWVGVFPLKSGKKEVLLGWKEVSAEVTMALHSYGEGQDLVEQI